MKTQEGKLKDAVGHYLKSIGALPFMPVQTGFGSHALDFIVCWRGQYIEIETKVLPRKPTGRQLQRIKDVRAHGGYAFVAYDLKTVKDFFECGTIPKRNADV